MKPDKKYVVLIVPFFNSSNHVGNYRIQRFIKWFNKNDYKVIVFSRGKREIKEEEWGINYSIECNTLFFLNKLLEIGNRVYLVKLFYIFFKIILKILLIPDEEKLWSNKIVREKKVQQIVQKASLILASSPLEASHIASYKFSKKNNIPVIVDLRDGWLDESLNLGLISKIRLRNYFEQKLEKKIYFNAKQIFVTSSNWKKALVSRYNQLENKVTVLTNAYPKLEEKYYVEKKKKNKNNFITLYYFGRFAGSSRKRKISLLFQPFKGTNFDNYPQIRIKIYSDLRKVDLYEINKIRNNNSKNNNIEYELLDFIPRSEILLRVQEADGLLLLSVSKNAIPAKFFEYVILNKPVLLLAHKNSSIWNSCVELPQFFLYDLDGNTENNRKATKDFLTACKIGNFDYAVPEKYSEEFLEKIFIEKIKKVL